MTTPTLPTPTRPAQYPLLGRWLHYGVQHHEAGQLPARYSGAAWNNACAQAASWGMQGVTPKVAEGSVQWYDDAGLAMIRDTARRHNLLCVPMHYCVGNTAGCTVDKEASLIAKLGKIYGAIVLDMEDPYIGQPTWMAELGTLIRTRYGYFGPLFPTTYANCMDHLGFPYLAMNTWATAWIPQAYFNLWTMPGSNAPMSAEYTANWLYTNHWSAFQNKFHVMLKPILPLIGLEPNREGQWVSPHEITNWLQGMFHYGYCGFWCDSVYAPYASAVLAGPMPALKGTTPPPVTVSPVVPKPVVSHPVTPIPPIIALSPALASAPKPVESSKVLLVPASIQLPIIPTSIPIEQQETVTVPTVPPSVPSVVFDGNTPVGQVDMSLDPSVPPDAETLSGEQHIIEDFGSLASSFTLSNTSTTVPGEGQTSISLQSTPLTPGLFHKLWQDAAQEVEHIVKQGGPTLEQLHVMWNWEHETIMWNPIGGGICQHWVQRMTEWFNWDWIGPPLHDTMQKTVNGVIVDFITFKSGIILIQFPGESRVFPL